MGLAGVTYQGYSKPRLFSGRCDSRGGGELEDQAAVAEVPKPDPAVVGTDREPLRGGVEGQGGRTIARTGKLTDFFAPRDAALGHAPIRQCDKEPLARLRHARDWGLGLRELFGLLPVGGVPASHDSIRARTKDSLAIAGERQAFHRRVVSAKDGGGLSIRRIADPRRAISAGGGEAPSIW